MFFKKVYLTKIKILDLFKSVIYIQNFYIGDFMKKIILILLTLVNVNLLAMQNQNNKTISQEEGLATKYEVIRPDFYNIFATDYALTNPAHNILLEATRILSNLKESYYEHTTTVDETNGIYKLDCSGLVGYILRYALNAHFIPIDTAKIIGQTRPLATDFYTFFNICPTIANPYGWMKISYLRNALPGDIIAWKYVDETKDNTGHIVVISGITAKFTEAITINNLKYWEYKVRVIDSSKSAHFQDSRDLTTNLTHEGIGVGDMYFGVNQVGEIKYWKWNSRSDTPQFDYIAIGRAIPIQLLSK